MASVFPSLPFPSRLASACCNHAPVTFGEAAGGAEELIRGMDVELWLYEEEGRWVVELEDGKEA